jgi:hypothetical protein
MQVFFYSHIMYLKVSAACYCGTFDQYVYKWTYFCFIVALILMKIYSQSWSSECINYLFIQSFSKALVTIMYLIA